MFLQIKLQICFKILEKRQSLLMSERGEEQHADVTLEEMKSAILSRNPELKKELPQWTDEEIRNMYAENQELFNIDDDELANMIYDEDQENEGQHSQVKREDNQSYVESQVEHNVRRNRDNNDAQTEVNSQVEDYSGYPSAESIRQFLISSFPQIKSQIRTFKKNQLMELYSTFKKSQKGQQTKEGNKEASKQVDQMQMIETIVKKYPTMKEKIISYTSAEIKSFYEKIKTVDSMGPAIDSGSTRNYDSIRPSRFNHESYQPKKGMLSSANIRNISNKPIGKSKTIEDMRRQLKNKTLDDGQIDKLMDSEIEELYNSQMEGANVEPQKKQAARNSKLKQSGYHKPMNIPQILNNNIYTQEQKYKPRANNTSKNPGMQVWQMDHKGQDQVVKARTYLMMHTEYETTPRKYQKGDDQMGKCNCACCKNNTFVNVFKQIVSQINSSK